MASFLPKSNPPFHVTMTQEEFNLFHKIDRELFTRFVVGLDRDTTKSTQVMAFILWVENKIKNRNIVQNLLQWPDIMLTKLAEEIELVIDCIESSNFPYGSYSQKVVPLIQTIMHSNVTLHYFHNNRVEISNGVTKFLNEVCLRAFPDIVQQLQYEKAVKEQNTYLANVYAEMNLNNNQDSYDYGVSREVMRNEDTTSIFANLNLDSCFIDGDAAADAGSSAIAVPNTDDQKKVAMDDRTIFMTFSKGYRISEIEIQEFFTRKYGNVVEAIFMQDVQAPEQPLYARLVVYTDAAHVIEHFLGGETGKLKFIINGKHVWARKFIRKGPPSPTEAGSSFCQW